MRVVLLHTTGPLAGIPQIGGTTDRLKADLKVEKLPDVLHCNTFHAGLVKMTPRYCLYQELTDPAAYQSMNPHQQ